MVLRTIILAAGIGKRMKSEIPKVLHNLCGKPILQYVIDRAKEINSKEIYVVVAHKKEEIIKRFSGQLKFIDQEVPLGTGHALRVCWENLKDLKGDFLILSGDVPLIKKETLINFYKEYKEKKADFAILSCISSNPSNYGRILRNKRGNLLEIKEERDCNEEELRIKEVNSGVYLLKWEKIAPLSLKLSNKNKQKEYYLTDLVKISIEKKLKVIAVPLAEEKEFVGINSREELSFVSKFLYIEKAKNLMENGVTIIDPGSTYINLDVEIGRDSKIYPGVVIENSKIGEKCLIYQNSYIKDSIIGDETIVYPFTMIEGCKIGKKCKIGPSAHLRPETFVGEGVRIGNFVETKKASIGDGTKAAHLTYLGDAIIGKNVNIGCGTITCNYDGIKKHQTIIEDGAFIGSDCQLVAPVKIGENAYTASGTTITDDVPPYSLAIARVKQKNVIDWVKRRRKK